MKIDADSITLEFVRDLWDKADDITNNLDILCCDIEDGEITPAEAAAKLREILAPLQVELEKPSQPDEPEWRYFAMKDRTCFWRFSGDKSGSRNPDQSVWYGSLYTLEEIATDEYIEEITAEEGEP